MIWVRFSSLLYSQNQNLFNSKFSCFPKKGKKQKKTNKLYSRTTQTSQPAERAAWLIKLLQHFPITASVRGGWHRWEASQSYFCKPKTSRARITPFLSFTGSPPYTAVCHWMQRVLRERGGREETNTKIKQNSLRTALMANHLDLTTHFSHCELSVKPNSICSPKMLHWITTLTPNHTLHVLAAVPLSQDRHKGTPPVMSTH